MANGWQFLFVGTPGPKPKKGPGISAFVPPLTDDSELQFWRGVAVGALAVSTGKIDAADRINEVRVKLEQQQQSKPAMPEPLPQVVEPEIVEAEEDLGEPLSLAEEAARLRRKVR